MQIHDDILIKILTIEAERMAWTRRLEEAGIDLNRNSPLNSPDSESLLDVVLDIMGVPPDNTVETKACERANQTGVWPADAFCRDGWMDDFYTIVEEWPAPERFPAYLQGIRESLIQLQTSGN